MGDFSNLRFWSASASRLGASNGKSIRARRGHVFICKLGIRCVTCQELQCETIQLAPNFLGLFYGKRAAKAFGRFGRITVISVSILFVVHCKFV